MAEHAWPLHVPRSAAATGWFSNQGGAAEDRGTVSFDALEAGDTVEGLFDFV